MTTRRNTKPSSRTKSLTPASRYTSLFLDAQLDVPPVVCTTQASFENDDFLDWDCNAKRPTKFSVSRFTDERLSVSGVSQAALVPARHRAFLIF